MRPIWLQFVDTLKAVLRQLRQGNRKFVLAGGGEDTLDLSEWVRCESLLDSVLVPANEYAYLKCRLKNALRYSLDAQFGAASYEIRLVLRRVEQLQRLYC